MASKQRRIVPVPVELANALTEMMVDYIMTCPDEGGASTDLIDFAFHYFECKLRDRQELESLSSSSFLEDRDSNEPRESLRRLAVMGVDDDAPDEDVRTIPKTEAQRSKLTAILKKIFLFKSLSPGEINELVDAMKEEKVSAGQNVITQGEDGYFFYVIEVGRFVAIQDGTVLKEYVDEGSFGELALMYHVPRACTVKAVTDGTLWAIDRLAFRRVVLNSALNKRKKYDEFIERVPMLSKLSPYERANLADALESKKYPAGSVIIKEGDPADRMFFILEGSVIVKTFDKITGEERILKKLQEGDYFGELALINKKPRAASAVAEGEVTVVSISVEAFERLLGPCMDVMKRKILDYDLETK